jgi:hypothetical protein
VNFEADSKNKTKLKKILSNKKIIYGFDAMSLTIQRCRAFFQILLVLQLKKPCVLQCNFKHSRVIAGADMERLALGERE